MVMQKMPKNINWSRVREELMGSGFSIVKDMMSDPQCNELTDRYDDTSSFRSKVIMARHNFGRGEYQYFSYPLPDPVQVLREEVYGGLAPIANEWAEMLNSERRYPAALDQYLSECHQAGQLKPTPLLLKYGEGDYNCLHQDLYGAEIFPLQMAVCLSASGEDFTGGEFVLTHQRPRMQSVVDVVPLSKGDAVIFAVNERPKKGQKGYYRIKMRHGVSKVKSGKRFVMGLIFHDAT